MSTAVAAGALLIALPLAFNAAFALLASSFDYPDVLRRPTSEVLVRFREGGSRLLVLWVVLRPHRGAARAPGRARVRLAARCGAHGPRRWPR